MESSFTLNGVAVAQWDDLSGNGHHLTQSNSALQPSFIQENGENWVDFGGNRWLDTEFTMPPGPVYVRIQIDPVEYDGQSFRYIFDGATSLDTMAFGMHANGIDMYSGQNFVVNDPFYTSQTVEPHLVEFVFNGENSKMAIAGNEPCFF